MIVIEGPDGTGKSTLASGLQAELSWPIIKFTKPLRRKRHTTDFNLSRDLLGQQVIQDRTPLISEYIYGSYHVYSPSAVRRMLKDVKLIYCTEFFDHEAYCSEDEEFFSSIDYEKIRAKYNQFLNTIPCFKFSSKTDIKKLLTWLEIYKLRQC